MEKQYVVKSVFGYTNVMTQTEFDAWFDRKSKSVRFFRVCGDMNADHFCLDFEEFFEITVKVIDKA